MTVSSGGSEVTGWTRDGNSLPCYERAQTAGEATPFYGFAASDSLTALFHSTGIVRLFTGRNGGKCLNPEVPQVCSAFYLRVHDPEPRLLLPPDRLQNESLRTCWGVGYMTCSGRSLVGPEDAELEYQVDFVMPPEEPWLGVALSLCLRDSTPKTLHVDVCSDLGPSSSPARRSPFSMGPVAMLTDTGAEELDYVLGGDENWEAAVCSNTLQLTRIWQTGTGLKAVFVLGARPDCSVAWVRQQVAGLDPDQLRHAWAEQAHNLRKRAPELWMQEESIWDAAQLRMFRSKSNHHCIVTPGPERFAAGADTRPSAPGSRDLIALGLPLTDIDTALAVANLRQVCCRQQSNGGFDAAPDEGNRRSDIEILFLMLACRLAVDHEEILDVTWGPGPDTPALSLWRRMCLSYHWIRDEIRTGPRGLIRMLAGDWLGWLNAVGRQGRGESVVNTAMLVYLLPALAQLARHRRDGIFADSLEAWHRDLSAAVGDAFSGRWFDRAYDDDNRSVGGSENGHLFLDAQAWVALARCGTASQREISLNAALQTASGSLPPPLIAPPYSFRPPRGVSSHCIRPGHGANGGINLAATAWFIWALVRERRFEDAFRIWPLMTLRHRLALAPDGLSRVLASQWGSLPGSHIQDSLARTWHTPYPNAHALAWIRFALDRILE